MCILAERRATHPEATWELFFKTNSDLLDQKFLECYYDPNVLASEVARKNFILPCYHEQPSD